MNTNVPPVRVAAQEPFHDERFKHPHSVARLHLQLRHDVGGR
jgi:hypothetical protein